MSPPTMNLNLNNKTQACTDHVKDESFSADLNLLNKNKSTKYAYVTFLAGNGDYIKGVVGLAKGLRKVGSRYPLVVAVLADVPQEHRRVLTSQGCIVREIADVYPPESDMEYAMAYYVINYSKLRIWEVCVASTCIFLFRTCLLVVEV